ncbi:MAG: hypothetical protein Q8N45_09905 [Anaerolineales bacterium]|nr:hypothetical protein [Anaerolineales bacterium]MDP3185952.1 hypothetical protein [Anaerolineales bacterium]
MRWLNTLLDKLSEFLAHRKGLLPLLGILLVLANLILQFFPSGWAGESNLLKCRRGHFATLRGKLQTAL